MDAQITIPFIVAPNDLDAWPFEPTSRKAPSSRPPRTDALPFTKAHDLDIEGCATIAAAIAWSESSGQEALAEAGLSAHEFAALRAQMVEVAFQEAERNNAVLLERYDDAYVAGLERWRGTITARDYAAIVVGAERGRQAESATARGIPPEAIFSIVRTSLRRCADDAQCAAAVERWLAQERG